MPRSASAAGTLP
ncbi:hypothetical protein GQ600_23320 [Phytophthora cactorum]|nr:hypothetical protein GQ600_23320 [Phytophthora cactorum]